MDEAVPMDDFVFLSIRWRICGVSGGHEKGKAGR
jgi:hypothetical protein